MKSELLKGPNIRNQCDQIVRFFFNIWPYATIKICPMVKQIRQSRLKILPNKKLTVKKLPKTCKILPKWLNFAKSGHSVSNQPRLPPPLLVCVNDMLSLKNEGLEVKNFDITIGKINER